MILVVCAAALLTLRIFYSFLESYFEKDWPRRTWKATMFAAIIFVFVVSVFA